MKGRHEFISQMPLWIISIGMEKLISEHITIREDSNKPKSIQLTMAIRNNILMGNMASMSTNTNGTIMEIELDFSQESLHPKNGRRMVISYDITRIEAGC